MTDDTLEADLRRIAATADPVPPPLAEALKSGIHLSHRPEPPGERLLPGVVACTVCCLLVAGTRGVLPAGERPCRGPGAIELRDAP